MSIRHQRLAGALADITSCSTNLWSVLVNKVASGWATRLDGELD